MPDITIVRARVYDVSLPLRVPFTISGGSLPVRRSLIVEVEDAAGSRGYGESAPFERPFYSAETVSSAAACLREVLIPRVVGTAFDRPEAVWEVLADGIRGNRIARAGIETAWWDLAARARGMALADLVTERLTQLGVEGEGVRRAPVVECGIAVGVPAGSDLSLLEEEVRAAIHRGYRRIKLKIRPGWDYEPVSAAQRVLESEGARLPMWVDANGAYDRTQHRLELAVLDEMGLLFLEQPFAEEALWDATMHNREARTPVCLDESLTSDLAARQVVAMHGPLIWNLKVQRVGGIEEACRIYARGFAAGAKMWVGTMPETGVGAQAALALAGHLGCVYSSDLEPSDRWYEPGTDVIELAMSPSGTMAVPQESPEPTGRSRMSPLFEIE